MNIYRIIIVALVVFTNGTAAMAEIYKCDSPDGPIYSDKKCAANATIVELSDSTGLTGISDGDKAALAQSKSDRDKTRNHGNDDPIINNQGSMLSVQDYDSRLRDRDNLKHGIVSRKPVTPQPKPSAPKKKRQN